MIKVSYATILISLIYISSIGGGMGSADSIQDATLWINKGKEAFLNADYNGAISAYDQALVLDKYYIEGWKLRGDALMEMKRYEEAADSYEHAIAIDKSNADLLGKKGRALYLLGKYQDAFDLYSKSVLLNPNLFQNQDGYGDVLSALNRFTEADQAYSYALKIEPNNNQTWNKKGEVLAKMFRNNEAVDAFNQSIQIYPDSAKVWNNLGSTYFSMGQMQEALKSFERAIALDESYIPQKYEDTLNRLAKDKQDIYIKPIEETAESTPSTPFVLPPAIFVLNYFMIVLGICIIIILGLIQVRKRKKKDII